MYDVTYDEILERMLDRIPDSFDKREGSVIWDTHSPTALELEILYVELNRLIAEGYGDTASREFLILRARERGLSPYPASCAVLKGIFTPPTVDVLGKRFNIGDLNFIVTEKITEGEYKVQCETPGIVGNQYMGQMIPIEYIEGLETAVLTAVIIPGEDEEETEDFRQRYFDSFNELAFGGNVKDYLEKTNAIPGVGATKVKRVWNSDIRPAEMIPSAAVDSWYTKTVAAVDGEVKTWLMTVYQAAKEKKLTVGGTVLLTILNSEYDIPAEELVQTVQTAIDPEVNAGEGLGIAPIGHVVTVQAAKEVKIAVTATVTFKEGSSWDNLQTPMDDAVKAYLLELRKEWAESSGLIVRVAQIETKILSIPGIIDITDTQVNGNAENLTLSEYEVPVFESISGGTGE